MSERSEQQGQAQYESIRDMVARFDAEDSDATRTAILEDALSVQVRSGWYAPGRDAGEPEEFEILLRTGGPAVRLTGTLGRHCEPDSISMQIQDWFEPWTDFVPDGDTDHREVMLTYARCFYFGG